MQVIKVSCPSLAINYVIGWHSRLSSVMVFASSRGMPHQSSVLYVMQIHVMAYCAALRICVVDNGSAYLTTRDSG